MSITNSQLILRPVTALQGRARNPRTHRRKQVRQIADSIRKFGFVTPILIDPALVVIAGHGRLEAAKMLGMSDVPTLMLEHLSADEIRAYVIADNQLASLAGWDKELLALEIAELSEIEDLDLTVTGFEVHDLNLLRDAAGSKPTRAEEPLPNLNRTDPAVSRLGDVWHIGSHRLACGNALERASYTSLMGEELADVVMTDPPYNVPIAGHVSVGPVSKHREFVMASGEMTREQFRRFLSTMCINLARASRPGSLHFIFMDWRSIGDLLAAGEETYDQLLNIIVWAKKRAGMGALYRSHHELVALFKHGKRPHKNNVALGANGRHRTNVWEYDGSGSGPRGKAAELTAHPTVKNLEMIADAIRDVSDPGDIVLDAFGGSGTTLIAAERCRRKARLLELDEHYCDLIIRRAQSEGLEARLGSGGPGFPEIAAERSEQAYKEELAS